MQRLTTILVTTILAAIAVLSSTAVLGHQPVISAGTDYPPETPVEVSEPEVSKAYFGVLSGSPHYYRIVSGTPFRFYAGVTKPKIDDCPLGRTFSLDVLDSDLEPIVSAEGEGFDWQPWYEEYGKKWYWVGPEIGASFKSDRTFEAGTYYVRVFNADNAGRYVLAIGDEEEFPLHVVVWTMIILPGINRDFWDEAECGSP